MQEEWTRARQEEIDSWIVVAETPLPLIVYLDVLSGIPCSDWLRFWQVRQEQTERYKSEVIAGLSCGFCGETGKLRDEWRKQECPRCGVAALDETPVRYRKRHRFWQWL